jgi:hypothetical protein
MGDAGTVALNLADAVRNVTIAAGPLVNWMVKLTVKGSEWVKTQADAGRESGKLATFFDHTRIAMSRREDRRGSDRSRFSTSARLPESLSVMTS